MADGLLTGDNGMLMVDEAWYDESLSKAQFDEYCRCRGSAMGERMDDCGERLDDYGVRFYPPTISDSDLMAAADALRGKPGCYGCSETGASNGTPSVSVAIENPPDDEEDFWCSDNDLKLVVEQTSCEEETARAALKKHGGDIISAIMEITA